MDPSDLALKLAAHIETTGPTYAGRPGELHHVSRVAKLLGLNVYEVHGAIALRPSASRCLSAPNRARSRENGQQGRG
jgi:hypothetical protein